MCFFLIWWFGGSSKKIIGFKTTAPRIFFSPHQKKKHKKITAFFSTCRWKNQGPPLAYFPRVGVLGPVVESLVQNPWKMSFRGDVNYGKMDLELFGVLRLMFLMFRCWLLLGTGVPSSKCILHKYTDLVIYLFIQFPLQVGSQSNRIISQRIEKKI